MTDTATYQAGVAIYRDGVSGGERLDVRTAEEVHRLVSLLAEPGTYGASPQAGENMPVTDIDVQSGYGYLHYFGYDDAISSGDPDSPAVELEIDFPAGSGVPLDQFRQAVVEFVTSGGQQPTAVEWRTLP